MTHQVAVVAGTNRGIGGAIAVALARTAPLASASGGTPPDHSIRGHLDLG